MAVWCDVVLPQLEAKVAATMSELKMAVAVVAAKAGARVAAAGCT